MIRLNITPKLESLPRLFAFCEEAGVDARTMLAVEEAFVNIVSHSGASRFSLACDRTDDGAVFLLEDDGVAFDPTAYTPDEPAEPDSLQAGGQGIRIIRSIVDTMTYSRVNNINKLTLTTKNIKP